MINNKTECAYVVPKYHSFQREVNNMQIINLEYLTIKNHMLANTILQDHMFTNTFNARVMHVY